MNNVVNLSPKPEQRGYHAAYRKNVVNHCPGCGRSHWYLGLSSAECGFCGTALPYMEAPRTGSKAFITRQNRHIEPAAHGRFTLNGKAA